MNDTDYTRPLDGKVALVTGASRGIGAAIAVRLAEHGADVALTYQNSDDRAAGVAEQIKDAGRRALVIRADSADPEAVTGAVDQTVSEFGRLDILVNNAGVFLAGPLEELGLEELDRTLAVNVRAPYVAARAAAGHMTGGGRIITIGSNAAERNVFPGYTLYALSKTALIGMTKGLARDLGPRGITVNLVQPGATNTDMNPADGPTAEAIISHIALGHYAEPADIAATVAHIAGPGGRCMTGTAVTVDGGYNI